MQGTTLLEPLILRRPPRSFKPPPWRRRAEVLNRAAAAIPRATLDLERFLRKPMVMTPLKAGQTLTDRVDRLMAVHHSWNLLRFGAANAN